MILTYPYRPNQNQSNVFYYNNSLFTDKKPSNCHFPSKPFGRIFLPNRFTCIELLSDFLVFSCAPTFTHKTFVADI